MTASYAKFTFYETLEVPLAAITILYILPGYILTKPCMKNQYSSDRPENSKKPAYLASFCGVFLGAGLCGAGGVLIILRSTSSGRGIGVGFCCHCAESRPWPRRTQRAARKTRPMKSRRKCSKLAFALLAVLLNPQSILATPRILRS